MQALGLKNQQEINRGLRRDIEELKRQVESLQEEIKELKDQQPDDINRSAVFEKATTST